MSTKAPERGTLDAAAHNIAEGLGRVIRWADEPGEAARYQEGVDMLRDGIAGALKLLRGGNDAD